VEGDGEAGLKYVGRRAAFATQHHKATHADEVAKKQQLTTDVQVAKVEAVAPRLPLT